MKRRAVKMKATELEQRLTECSFRLSKIEQQLKEKEEENAELKSKIFAIEQRMGVSDGTAAGGTEDINQLGNRIQGLSDELYEHIATQVSGVNEYMNSNIESVNNRIQCLSDELYTHLGNVLRNEHNYATEIKSGIENERWMRTYGYDGMISEIQMALVEERFKGNRDKLKAMKDSHVGERCFVIGNGPSLRAEDLTRIKEAGIFSFASKGIYNIFDDTEWRPDVWGVSDLDYVEVKQDDIKKLKGFTKLICAQAYITKGIEVDDAIYYPFIQNRRTPSLFYLDVMRGVQFYGTITGKLINFAEYMGFKEIYILGVDNSFPKKIDENGNEVVDTTKPLHFKDDSYMTDDEKALVYKNIVNLGSDLAFQNKAYEQIRYACEEQGIKIINVTRGGELNMFERKSFDDLDFL